MDSEESLVDPGERLRSLRRSREISQRHLADISGIHQAVICRLERGRGARWETWVRLFGALGYLIVLQEEEFGEDDLEDFLRDGIRTRKESMEAGRERRW